MLLGVCPLFFSMTRFMNCFLNKDGMAAAHYFLYPFRTVDVIVSKNIALLGFQYSITIPFATIGVVMIWSRVSWQEIVCLVISMISFPVFMMAWGNFVAVTNPRKIARAFSVISTPETTKKGMVITATALVSGIAGIALMYLIPKFVLQSETTAVILFLNFAVISSVFYKWSISRTAILMEKGGENILSKLEIC